MCLRVSRCVGEMCGKYTATPSPRAPLLPTVRVTRHAERGFKEGERNANRFCIPLPFLPLVPHLCNRQRPLLCTTRARRGRTVSSPLRVRFALPRLCAQMGSVERRAKVCPTLFPLPRSVCERRTRRRSPLGHSPVYA